MPDGIDSFSAVGFFVVSSANGTEFSIDDVVAVAARPAPATQPVPPVSTTLSQTELDHQKAQRVLLTAADVPGFTTDAPGLADDNSELKAAVNACLNNNPVVVQLGEDTDPRGAGSPDFSKGEDQTVSSSVTFADTEDLARSAVTDLSAATFSGCLSRAVTTELRKDRTLTNVTVTTTKLPALTVGDQSVGYRSVAKFRSSGTAVTLNVDSTFIRSGRALAVLGDSSVTSPFPEAERVRLATLIAGRMAAP